MAVDLGQTLNLDVGPAIASLDKLGTAADAAAAAVRQGQGVANAALAESARAANLFESQLSSIVVESQRGAAAQQQFAREISGLVKGIRDQTAATEAARQASAAAAAERRKANQEARAAAQAEKAAAKEVAEAEKQAAAAARLAAKEAANAAKQAGQSGEAASGLGKIFGNLQGQIAAAFSIAAVKAFIGNVVEAGQAAEATLSKLTFANGGNTQAAARDLAFIRSEADRLGLELNGAGKSYGSFTAAAAAANFPLAEARKLFLATAGASATLKLSADDTQGVLLALTQVLSKGTVQAEELRGQIGERLPGAFAIAARSMGVTEQQLNKLLQTGQVKSADFLPKFAEELQKTFGDGTSAAADSFTANLARIENEFSAFFLRFQGAASAGTSKIAEIFKRFNEGIDLRTAAGQERLGERAAQPGIKAYEALLAELVAKAEKDSKAAGTDIAFGVGALLAQQGNLLAGQLEQAKKDLLAFDVTTKEGSLKLGNFRGGADAFRQEAVRAQERVKLLEGEIAKLGEVAAARKKADEPTDLEGLVKRQEDLIKAIKLRQLTATQENAGGGKDFLLGKGGLDEQLKAAEKELDRLLGKVDKAAKGAADKLAAALKALAAAREQLQSKAAAAATKDADDQATRAKLAFEESIRQVGVVEQKLRAAEARVRAAGGRGEKADGVIDGAQAQQLATLRVAALDAYYKELYKIELARDQRLFDLRADSAQKEIDAVNRKYDQLLAKEKLGQSAEYDALDEAAGQAVDRQRKRSQEEIAIAEARQRDLLALQYRQQQAASDQQANLATSRVQEAGATFGTGTGISIIEAKEAEKRALLAIEKKHAEDVLQNSLLLGTREGELARAQADARLAQVNAELRAIDQEKAKHKATDSFYKLVFGEDDSNELRDQFEQTAQQAIGAINQILSAQLAAEQAKVQAHQDNINSLQSQLSAEIALNASGSASNIKNTIDQLNAEKAAKREALAESRAIAKQQQAINDLQSASSLALAVSNIIAGWSTVPLAGSILGLLAAAATVTSFVATKASLASQTQTQGSFLVGGYTGDGNRYEESQAVGRRPYTYHKGEFVMPHELTEQFRHSLFEPLHKNRPQDINWTAPELAALLPNFDLPDQMRAEKAAHYYFQQSANMEPMRLELAAMRADIAHLKGTNERMADKPETIPLGGDRFMEKSANGSIKVVSLGG